MDWSTPQRADSKQKLLLIYKRFWWSENQKWYDSLNKAGESLKEGDENQVIINERLDGFLKMESDFVQAEARKVLSKSEYKQFLKSLKHSTGG